MVYRLINLEGFWRILDEFLNHEQQLILYNNPEDAQKNSYEFFSTKKTRVDWPIRAHALTLLFCIISNVKESSDEIIRFFYSEKN